MIIIVEGIDRVGKTTLCNALSNALNIPIYKHTQVVMDYASMDNINETDKMLQLIDVCKITNSNIIFDRFHFSDYVYGTIERNYNDEIAITNLNLIDSELKNANAILIIVCPTDIKSSSQQHGKDLLPYLLKMQYAYTLSSIQAYSCDYNSIQKTVEIIKEKYNGTI